VRLQVAHKRLPARPAVEALGERRARLCGVVIDEPLGDAGAVAFGSALAHAVLIA
jgi:hypothetical protein